jgi:CysZ protein
MIKAFTQAFLNLKDPRILKLVAVCAALTVLIYAGLFAGLVWVLRHTDVATLPWLETLLDLGAGAAAAILAWVLFPGIVSGLIAAFLDTAAEAVESGTYPGRIGQRRPPFSETAIMAARLVAYTIGLNLLFLPVYLLLIFAPPLNLIAFYAVNGRLLGREYFETVALRHFDGRTVADFRARNGGTIWVAGAITAALLTVPVLNFVAPIVGMAAMVHLFHKLTASEVRSA